MAEKTKFEIPTSGTPKAPTEIATPFYIEMAVKSGDAANGDNFAVFTAPNGAVFEGVQLHADATLGAGATLQARVNTTAITGATTAGAASRVRQNAAHAPSDGTHKLNLLVGGADITADATVRVTGWYVLKG